MKKLLFLLALVFVFGKSKGQWTQEGNDGVPPFHIFDLDSFYLTFNSYGIYKSINNGASWSRIESVPAILFGDLEVINSKIIASCTYGIYISNDYGATWTSSNSGMTGIGGSSRRNNLVQLPNNEILFATENNGIYKSIDEGLNWVYLSGSPTNIRSFVFDLLLNKLFCGTQSGIFSSSDFGQNWLPENNGLSSTNINNLEILNDYLFCTTTSNQIFIAENNLMQWTLTTGLTGTYIVPSLNMVNNKILANRTTGVHIYNFASSQFEVANLNQGFPVAISDGINQVYFGAEIISNKAMFIQSLYTNDLGNNWVPIRGIMTSGVSGFSSYEPLNLFFDGAAAGCYSAALDTSYYLLDEPFTFGTVSGNVSNSLKYQNQKFYCATNSGIWISSDSAQTWVQYLSGLPATQPGNYHYVYDLEVFGDTIIAGTPSGPYISTDGGNSFSISNFPGAATSYDLLFHQGKLYSGGSPKMLVSSDRGTNWTQFGSTTDVFQQMAASGQYIYSASDQSIYLTIGSIGNTANITGNLDPFIGIGNNPGIAAYDSLLFVSNFFRVGVHKMNVNQPGVYTDISDNLPVYEESPGFYQYPYLSFAGKMTIFHDKLWLGTAGMSCFTRPLSDFGFPPVVVNDHKNKTKLDGDNTIRIYPNPANGELKITGLGENANIEIYGQQGELIHSNQNIPNNYITLDISNFAKGIYFVKVNNGQGNFRGGKFVKQ
jgi:photosystem II stability/assembly factor-like uncharacterized protein